MSRLSISRLAFSIGAVSALFYLGCVLLMLILPQERVIAFFNSLLHGWDVAPIMRWDMPWWEALLGVVQIFILGWFCGALVAAIYNLSGRCCTERRDT